MKIKKNLIIFMETPIHSSQELSPFLICQRQIDYTKVFKEDPCIIAKRLPRPSAPVPKYKFAKVCTECFTEGNSFQHCFTSTIIINS